MQISISLEAYFHSDRHHAVSGHTRWAWRFLSPSLSPILADLDIYEQEKTAVSSAVYLTFSRSTQDDHQLLWFNENGHPAKSGMIPPGGVP
jgi:hypothetical protein